MVHQSPTRFFRLIRTTALLAVLCAVGAAAAPHVERLENGLLLILEEDHSRPLVAACLFVKGGSRTEPDSLKGLSHYYEHLIFRGGSERQAPMEYRKSVQEIGEESGGYTTDDYTCYGYTVPTVNLDEMLWRSADAWLDLVPDEEKIDIEREVVVTEYWQGRDRPDYLAWYQLEEALYPVHSYHTPTIGRLEVIEQADLQTFRTFYEERYVPNQMVLAMVGDFDVRDLSHKIRSHFAHRPRGRESFELGLEDPPQTSFRLVSNAAGAAMTQFCLGFRIPPSRDEMRPTLRVLSTILGDGRASRLYKALKEREPVVQEIAAGLSERVDDGMLVIWGSAEPGNERAAVAGMMNELRRLVVEPVGASELEAAKTRLYAQEAFDTQTFYDRAERYAWFAVMSCLGLASQQEKMIASVTAEEIQAAADRFLRPENATLSIVRPESAVVSDSLLLAEADAWNMGLPALAPSAQMDGIETFEAVLDGGMTFVARQVPSDRVAAAIARFAGGQWSEPEGKWGVGSLCARLLLKGTRSRSAEELTFELDRLGARLDASGGSDALDVWIVAPEATFPEAFGLFLEVLTEPAFDSKDLGVARAEQLGEIRSLAEEPFSYTNRAFDAVLFANTPYGRSVLGDSASVEALGIGDVRDYFDRNLVAARSVVAAAGAIDPKRIAAALQSAFQKRLGGPFSYPDVVIAQPERTQDVWVGKDQAQITYNTGWPAIGMRHRDYLPLKVAASILGRRFFYEFVYEKPMAYRSWFYMRDRMGPSAIQNEMGVNPENYAAASGGILAGVKEFLSGPLDPATVESGKNRLLATFAIRQQRPLDVARLLALGAQLGEGAAYLRMYPERVRNVPAEAVYEAAHRYLMPERFVRVAVGSDGVGPPQ